MILKTIPILFFTLLFSGCASLLETSEPVPPLERYNPDFSYSVTEENKAIGSADLTIALIKPYYPNVSTSGYALDFTTTPPFDAFSNGIQETIDKLLLNKGALVKGPYGETEEIVYSEKREIDLYLKTELAITVNTNSLQVYNDSREDLFGNVTKKYTVEGPMGFGGFVYLRMESETGTLLWKKELKLDPTTIEVKSENGWQSANAAATYYMDDTAIYNSVANQMEEYFKTSSNLLSSYISIPEFNELKKQLENDNETR